MVWSWSHTQEAYVNLSENIARRDREWLEEVYAEWKSNPKGHFHPEDFGSEDFDDRRFDRAKSAAKYIATESLIERIWEWCERQARCENGGWQAWVCPYGCHTAPFSRECDECERTIKNDDDKRRHADSDRVLCVKCDEELFPKWVKGAAQDVQQAP